MTPNVPATSTAPHAFVTVRRFERLSAPTAGATETLTHGREIKSKIRQPVIAIRLAT
jgi:hypothetical protein